MTAKTDKGRRLTPLWIISLFVSLTETVAGIAATQVSGGIQIAFTAFAVGFPVLVAVAFFLILWNRPYVFYSPSEFGKQPDVHQFVKAMGQMMQGRRRSLLSEEKIWKGGKAKGEQQINAYRDYQSLFILYLVYKQLEKGRVDEILEWFDGFKEEESLLVNLELALLWGSLARLCGRGEAFSRLQAFRETQLSFYEVAQYELALLKSAKPRRAEEIVPVLEIEQLSSGIRRLWASLLALCYLSEQNLERTNHYLKMSEPEAMQDDAYDAYASIQIAIVAAALGQLDLAVKYFDIARNINRGKRYPVHGYPYISTVAKHNRAFVNTVLGVDGASELKKEDIQLLRGHSHVVARYSHILRLCEPALDSMVMISQSWNHPLDKKGMKHRLLEFENNILTHAGTLFLGA